MMAPAQWCAPTEIVSCRIWLCFEAWFVQLGGNVRKKIVFAAITVAALWLTIGGNSLAQIMNPCVRTVGWASSPFQGEPVTPPWFIVSEPPCLFCITYGAYLSICPDPNAGRETCPTCPHAGQPISLATGNTFIEEVDLRLPGLGGGLSLVRRWNSVWPSTQIASSVGMFGPNWRSTYEERVFMAANNYLKYSRGDGSYWSFGLGPTGATIVSAPANVSASFVAGSSNWTITFLNGEQRQFNPTTGLLTAIVDRNGNTIQLTYDSSNRLTTVTDPTSRHLYFNYPNGSSFLVSSVTSDFGITLSYAYDSQGRLIQVTKPDLTTVSFTYNSQSQITAVTDNNGKVLESHTYDSNGRGLTSSLANGIESLTITYP